MALASANREWVFKKRPGADSVGPSNFELRDCAAPEVEEGQLLLSLHLMSLDPTLRNAMAGPEAADRTDGSWYWDFMNWKLDTVPSWTCIAQVVKSRAEGFAPGDMVEGFLPWRELVSADAGKVTKVQEGISPAASMSALGMTARTAYIGCRYVAEAKEGDVAFVSAAGGATGLAACQILKALGCRVIGSARTDEKVAFLSGIGVEAFNYKKETVLAGLKRLCPEGLSVAFDNVGGETLEATLEMMNDDGRVALCGAISQYELLPSERYGVRNLFHCVAKRLRLQGFIHGQNISEEQTAEMKKTLADWFKAGKITEQCTFADGFEKMPEGLVMLFNGGNIGKTLVRCPLRESAHEHIEDIVLTVSH